MSPCLLQHNNFKGFHGNKNKKAVAASPAPQLLFIISITYLLQGKGAGSGPDKIKVIIKRKACLPNDHVNFPSNSSSCN
jgi:hypothetical protein